MEGLSHFQRVNEGMQGEKETDGEDVLQDRMVFKEQGERKGGAKDSRFKDKSFKEEGKTYRSKAGGRRSAAYFEGRIHHPNVNRRTAPLTEK